MTELESYKSIVNSCFKLQVNLNDTFYWATADIGEIDSCDISKILHIYQQCGRDTLVAYEAIIRGHDPDPSLMKRWKKGTADFYRAKAMLQPLADTGKIMFERWYDLQEKKIEHSLFNGQEIIWEKDRVSLPDGTYVEDKGSISDKRNALLRKYNAEHNIPIQKCSYPEGRAKSCPRCQLYNRSEEDRECLWPGIKVPGEIE